MHRKNLAFVALIDDKYAESISGGGVSTDLGGDSGVDRVDNRGNMVFPNLNGHVTSLIAVQTHNPNGGTQQNTPGGPFGYPAPVVNAPF